LSVELIVTHHTERTWLSVILTSSK